MNFANPHIQALTPYSPPLEGRSGYPGMLLDFNERTVSPSQKALDAITNFIEGKKLNLYPEYFDFCERIAAYAKVSPEQAMVTNGSDQGIDLIFRTFTQKDDEVIIPSPSFAMFYQCAGIMGNKIIKPEYCAVGAENFQPLRFPCKEILGAITSKTKLIVLCSPNNPTGTPISLEQIEAIIQKAPNAIVYVDEAYYEFSGVTAAGLISKYPNLIITRTFSKAFGLAALRVGYVLSGQQNIEQMLKVRGPYDINSLAYYAATGALDDIEDLEKYVEEVMNRAKPLMEKFFTENGIQFFESTANFLLFFPKSNPQKLFKKLKQDGCLLRPRKGYLGNTLRLSIGTKKQMEDFITIFSPFL